MTDGKIRMGYEGREQARQATVGDDLWQMHAAGAKIAEFSSGSSAEDFAGHEVLRAAVERMLVLMAEAWTRLELADREQAEKFSNGPALQELASRLESTGGDVPTDVVWSFIQNTLPSLIAEAQEELERWHG